MKRGLSRVIVLALAAVLILSLIPAVSAAASDDLYSTVNQQVRTYAKSINKADAASSAASAMATHGLLNGGRKMTAGAAHALTATLMNSEIYQAALSKGITNTIRAMEKTTLNQTMILHGSCSWYDNSTSRSYKDTTAKKNTTYYYKVVAVCQNTAGIVSIKSK